MEKLDIYQIYDMLKASKDDANLAIGIIKNNITEFTPLQLFIITLLITKYNTYRDIMMDWNLFGCYERWWSKWDEFDNNKESWQSYILISDNIQMEHKFQLLYCTKINQLAEYLKAINQNV